MTGRELSPDDRRIWNAVAASVEPMHGTPAPEAQPEARAAKPPSPPPGSERRMQARRGLPDPQSFALDANTLRRLRRGEIEPEQRLDLHGLGRAAARAKFEAFLARCSARRVRLVLVITGRGGSKLASAKDHAPGVLRQALPQWIEQTPIRGQVVHYGTAHRSHGGDGAYYLYLRKSRSRR